MKFFSALFFLIIISLTSFSQSGQWAWMKGDTIDYAAPVWGTKGVGDPANTPAPKYSYYHWQDTAGNFWIYSGLTEAGPYVGYNDLWKFDINAQNWIWMHGDTTNGSPAIYGVQGIPSLNNTPGFRFFGGLCWTGKDGKFWLTGAGPDAMMMYDPIINEWTWMSGSTSNVNAFFGTKGVPSPDNTPGDAAETNASWVDDDGNLWFYGGQGPSTAALWKYDITTLEWTWMSGDSIYNALPVYGIQGVPDVNNRPGGRWCYASWKDDQDNFWLFGGNHYDPYAGEQSLNDVWKYSPSTGEWTWMSGDTLVDQPGNAGAECEFSTVYIPGSRWENRACLRDTCGNVWMYGGHTIPEGYSQFCDLWIYRPQLNDWAWLGSNCNHHYGIKEVPDALNSPGMRMGSVTWFDRNGNMWLFGGISWLYSYYSQDLWKFIPDQDCMSNACVVTSTNDELIYQNDLKAYPNPSSGIFTIEIPLDGNLSIEIRNVIGELIFSSVHGTPNGEEKNIQRNLKKQIDLTDQASGIYFLLVKNNEQRWVKKFLIVGGTL
ncbi:MAG TPA: T9SS type A sorting domain-containing protein [Chitinophagales bacterium]|nr:T9SS type A sorting domain-containing protein [Chitinophagales bacterium]